VQQHLSSTLPACLLHGAQRSANALAASCRGGKACLELLEGCVSRQHHKLCGRPGLYQLVPAAGGAVVGRAVDQGPSAKLDMPKAAGPANSGRKLLPPAPVCLTSAPSLTASRTAAPSQSGHRQGLPQGSVPCASCCRPSARRRGWGRSQRRAAAPSLSPQAPACATGRQTCAQTAIQTGMGEQTNE
jgi:hypothetical protein